MKNLRGLLATGAAMGVTLALIGCTSGTPTEEARAQQWYLTSSVTQSSFDSTTWDGSSSYSGSDATSVSYQLDKHGNVTKRTEVSDYQSEDNSTKSEITAEYTRDENGWPLTKTQTEKTTSTFSYDDGTGQMVEDTSESGPFVTEIEYSYEYDDKGRVVKGTSTDINAAAIELTYADDGTVASCIRHEPMYTVQNKAVQDNITSTYNAQGKKTSEEVLTLDEFGNTIAVAHSDYDEDGLITKTVTTRSQDGGADLVETKDYVYEKTDDGNYRKLTETITGDGISTTDRAIFGSGNKWVRETYLPDGSIKAQTIDYAPDYSEVLGDAKTYEGPYSVSEQSFDDAGRLTSFSCTYYDGSVYRFENSYDSDGNVTSTTYTYEDGSSRTYEYGYDKNGNQISSKLVDSSYIEGNTYQLKTEDVTSEWTQVKEPSIFASLNGKLFNWS